MPKSKSQKVSPAVTVTNGVSHALPAADALHPELTEKIKELIRLAKEQGQLTFDDVGDILTEKIFTPANLDFVFAKLRELEIEVVESAEVDRVKPADAEEAEEEERSDSLDDPVRTYLRQMGAVDRKSVV